MPTNIEQPESTVGLHKRPHGRSLSDFGVPWPAEDILLEKARLGELCEFPGGALGTCPEFEGNLPETWPEDERRERTLRAEFVRFLALGGDKNAPVHERGLWVKNAIIKGNLDFHGCRNVLPIALEHCLIVGRVILRDAKTRTINLDYSHICGNRVSGSEVDKSHLAIEAKRAKIDGSMYCRRGFVAEGLVNFIEAELSGSFECHGGKFKSVYTNKNGDSIALSCSRMKVGGSVFFTENFVAEGQVRFQRAEIGADLNCDTGQFIYPEKDALYFGSPAESVGKKVSIC